MLHHNVILLIANRNLIVKGILFLFCCFKVVLPWQDAKAVLMLMRCMPFRFYFSCYSYVIL